MLPLDPVVDPLLVGLSNLMPEIAACGAVETGVASSARLRCQRNVVCCQAGQVPRQKYRCRAKF